ncbi:MAG: electron transfer flavoprotein subunit beta/FixA family protein [candidate division Zixibacteria bacterium]
MKIAVLVKQTPQLSEVAWGGDGLKWPDDVLAVNPFDEYAVEEAIRIKEKIGGATIAITFGGPDSVSVLRDVLALGIDEAYQVQSDNYSSTDPQSNARALAACIQKIGDVDLVLTGKSASDDDSGLVGPAVAGQLDWPQISYVKKIEKIEDSSLIAWRTTDSGHDVVESSLPAVCSVVKEINEPRLPSLKGKMKAKKAQITSFTLQDLGVEPTPIIKIKSIEAPPPRPQGEILQGETDEVIEALYRKLKDDKLI